MPTLAVKPNVSKLYAMKRVQVRPGKFVLVSDEAMERARNAAANFGVAPEQMNALEAYRGDETMGPKARVTKPKWWRIRRP